MPGEIAEEQAGFRRFEGSCVLCTTGVLINIVAPELAARHLRG